MSVVKPRRYEPTGIGRTCARYDLDEPFRLPSSRPARSAGINLKAIDPHAGDPTMGSLFDWDKIEAANARSRAGRKAKGVVRGVIHAEETP